MKQQPTNWRTLLHRWISGEADRNDERSLEVLAKDDPFLADALEGYRSIPEADHARTVTKLKANLRKRNEKKNRAFVFYLKRIAAVGLVVVGVWLVFRALDDSNKNEVALEERAEVEAANEASTASVASDSIVDSEGEAHSFSNEIKEKQQGAAGFAQMNDVVAVKEENSPPPIKIAPPPANESNELAKRNTTSIGSATAEKRAKADSELETKDNLAAAPKDTGAKKYVQEDHVLPLADGAKAEASQPAATAKKSKTPAPEVIANEAAPTSAEADDSVFLEQEMDNSSTQSNALYAIMGKVTDAQGEPLIGANVLIKNTSQVALTDIDGSFSISSPIENPTLIITYTGFKSQEVKANSDEFLPVQLSDNGEQLNEVAVTKLFQRSKSKELEFEPKGGFKKFEKYIEKNLQKPQAAIDANVSGQVEIGFSIDATGRPNDFKTIRSLGYGCDEEAIRLLQEGPDWNGPIGIRHTYTFSFE